MDVKKGIRQLDIEVKAQLLTGSSFWTTAECAEIGLSSVFMSDGPHGMRVQSTRPSHLGMGGSRKATCFPTASAMACSWDEELCEELGKRLGEEAAYQGVSVVLGPGLNVKRSPLCGRNFEYFSEDSYLSGKLAAAYVRGIQSKGVTSCIKHFAVNSRELGRMVCDCAIDEQTLRETYLTAFEIAVKEGGAGAVMTAYNKINGVYCNENKHLITDILRGEWGYEGLVVSDWGGGRDKAAAVDAGADLEMPRCMFSAKEVVDAVKDGRLDERKVDGCVERLYALARKSEGIDRLPFDEEEHDLFAEKCAGESLVLLKNEGGALPLSKTEKVALIGEFAVNPRYQGGGSSLVNPTYLDNILGAIKSSGLNFIGFAQGFKRFDGKVKHLVKGALRLAEKADTVLVCLGLDEDSETEGSDRSSLLLPANQTELLTELAALNKKIIVVLSCGSVVDTGWDVMADAVLHAHLCGQSGARAVVKALTGEINPSGRLAESYPVDLSDVPCHGIYDGDPYRMNYNEGIYVGYKYYNSQSVAVKYPFGYGLSYTQFEYSDFSADERGATFTVRNAGGCDGATVAQIYITCLSRSLENPPAELKAFKKIRLAAGESKEVFLPFDEYAFRIFNAVENGWQSEGEYVVSLGENSRDILFSQTLSLGGAGAVNDGEKQSYSAYYAANKQALGEREAQEKPKRVVASYTTIVRDLLRSKGLVGKLLGFVAFHYNTSKDKIVANSMSYLPLRSLMQFMDLNYAQAEGLIEACNGKFFKGVKKLIFKK